MQSGLQLSNKVISRCSHAQRIDLYLLITFSAPDIHCGSSASDLFAKPVLRHVAYGLAAMAELLVSISWPLAASRWG